MIAADVLPEDDVANTNVDEPSIAAPPCPPEGEWTGEVIAGYRVHPYASRFPLMVGIDFDELVESIAAGGVEVPIELHEGMLIDGRNRARAVEVLLGRGNVVELPVTEWRPRPGESIERRIYNLNAARRHLTPDQKAVLALPLLPGIRADCNARQAETRFGSPPRASSGTAVETSQPPEQGGQQERSCSEKTARSAIGALSRLAGTSTHPARMAIEAAAEVKAGLLPPEELEAVARGEKKLSRILRRNRKSPRQPAAAPTQQRAPVDDFLDEASGETEATITEPDVRRRWDQLKGRYPITEHRELRRILAAIIAAEQRQFDHA
jgi:hypothetical protein